MSAISSRSSCRTISITDMELRQLEIFAAVAKYKSFSEAARRLYISHSTTCRTVSALEEELGVQLVVRDNRVTGLTVAGERLLEEAAQLEKAHAAAAERVRAAGKETEVDRD